jgi:aspartyl-tRNA(Asn)/glutamyl-tRNA(Gln) amidotransferase subunit C
MDVKRVAKLARLCIPEEKVAKMEADMNDILRMVENLPDLSSADALIDVNNTMELREDVIVPSYPRDEMLKNAPKAVAGCIVVPKTVD